MPLLQARLAAALAGRYVIDREIGRGGMALVLLAQDLKHDRRVALKVLQPELAASIGADRFLREIQIVARLQHPHIVPLYESGQAAGEADGDSSPLLYYVMPFVEGQTLRDRLTREPRLPIEDAVQIARDIAAALDYAHRNGVVHRDIKPENVMLHEGEAMVADFGIARAVRAAGNETLTQVGTTVGTPAYMSPEQASGDSDPDGRTDIYSLGCVLYEMLTGSAPFAGPSVHAVIMKRFTDSPPSAQAVRSEVSAELDQLITRSLARDPAERFPTADLVAQALGSPGMVTPTAARSLARPRRHGRFLATTGIATATVVGLGFLFGPLSRSGPPSLDLNRIVVAQFVNETGDSTLNGLGRLAADWITQGLGETGFAEVVSSRTVRQLAIQDGEAHAELETTRGLAQATGAATVIEGAYYRDAAADVRIQARIVDATTGRVLRDIDPVRADTSALVGAVDALRARTMAALATMRDPRAAGAAAHGSQPPTFEAYKEYATGEELFIRRDWRSAIEHFERAAARDSAYVLPLLWIAIARIQLGQPEMADSIARVLEPNRQRLAPMDLTMLDWLIAYLRGDAMGRYRASRRQTDIAPGSEAAMQFALEALRIGRPREAIAASATIDPTRGAVNGRYGYWNVLTAAHHQLGDHRRELRESERGVAQYPGHLHTLLYEARALAALGREEAVAERVDAALALPVHPTATPGLVIRTAAIELRAHGHPDAARGAIERALRWYADRPATEQGGAEHQAALGRALYVAGRWEDARGVFAGLAAADTTKVEYLGYLGVLAARMNDREEAIRIADQLHRLDRRYLWGEETCWRARIAALLGGRVEAVALLRTAAAEGYRYAWDHHADVDLESLRDFPPFQALLHPSE